MKTSIKSLATISLIALATISSSTIYASNGSTPKAILASAVDISDVHKIIVMGNVSVHIVQAPKSKVLYENENKSNVTVRKYNNSLTIDASKSTNTAEITVYIDDIYRIDASGDAIVQTEGTLNLKNLQVFVKDNAKVEVNAKTESLYTTIKDRAELKLQGHAESHILTMDKLSKITLENFSATKTEKNNSDIATYAAIKK